MKVTLEELLAHMKSDRRIHREFTFTEYNTPDGSAANGYPNCGFAGCMLGEMPALDPRWEFQSTNPGESLTFDGNSIGSYGAGEYFGISGVTASFLFYPDHFPEDSDTHPSWYKPAGDHAALDKVLGNLERFLEFRKQEVPA